MSAERDQIYEAYVALVDEAAVWHDKSPRLIMLRHLMYEFEKNLRPEDQLLTQARKEHGRKLTEALRYSALLASFADRWQDDEEKAETDKILGTIMDGLFKK